MKRAALLLALILLTTTVLLWFNHTTGPHVYADTPRILGQLCADHPGACSPAPLADQTSVVARVQPLIQAVTGGGVPSRIDITRQTAGAVSSLLHEQIGLPDTAAVWYVRIYEPVHLVQRSMQISPSAASSTYNQGAGWVFDAQSGLPILFVAFRD